MKGVWTINGELKTLAQAIREGKQPDACHLVSDFFQVVKRESINLPILDQFALYHFVYSTLIEVICDDLLMRHWRQHCLNYLYLPLAQMRLLAVKLGFVEQWRQLDREATRLSHYFLS